MMEEKKVSVILCFYNEERYLREAVDSILSQTYRNIELLVINDGSKDGSEDIIKSYDDPRIVYHPLPENKGLAHARNVGLSLATGEYAGFFDADDRMLSDKTEKEVRFLEEHPEITVVSGSFYYMDAEGKAEEKPLPLLCHSDKEIRAFMLYRNAIAVGGALFRRADLADRNAVLDETNRASEDYRLWISLLPEIRFANLAEPVYYYRVGHSSKASVKAKKDPEAFVRERKEILRTAWKDRGIALSDKDIDFIFRFVHESRRVLAPWDLISMCGTYNRIKKLTPASLPEKEEILGYYKRLIKQSYHWYWTLAKIFSWEESR